MEAEMAHNLHRDYEQGGEQLSAVLRQLIERGRTHSAVEHQRAIAAIDTIRQAIDSVFDEYDAIITPAAPGPAPRDLQRTGNPIFCTIWTYLGMPAVTLPLLASEQGLPMGLQLVGRRDNDARLLRTATWLVNNLGRRGRPRAAAKAGPKPPARKGKSK
jgi:Asp-tRNA(Asn)/Glu-tRNA(Gln) amidotransferase A subunit family amidase